MLTAPFGSVFFDHSILASNPRDGQRWLTRFAGDAAPVGLGRAVQASRQASCHSSCFLRPISPLHLPASLGVLPLSSVSFGCAR